VSFLSCADMGVSPAGRALGATAPRAAQRLGHPVTLPHAFGVRCRKPLAVTPKRSNGSVHRKNDSLTSDLENKNMLRSILIAAIASATPAVTSAAGECHADANSVSTTYGFAAQGVATADTAFAPAGPFAQAGTATQLATSQTSKTISGTWSVELGQNDTHGYTPDVAFGGTFQIDRATCTGEFYVTTPVALTAPAFHVVVVADGDEVRVISAIPNLIVAYVSPKRLNGGASDQAR
jgi:hypothetical protein